MYSYKEERIVDDFNILVCRVVRCDGWRTITFWSCEEFYSCCLSCACNLLTIIRGETESFKLTYLVLNCVYFKGRYPQLINLVELFHLKRFESHEDHLVKVFPARIITLRCLHHEDKVHRCVRTLCHVNILEEFVSLKHANLRSLYPGILIGSIINCVYCCIK